MLPSLSPCLLTCENSVLNFEGSEATYAGCVVPVSRQGIPTTNIHILSETGYDMLYGRERFNCVSNIDIPRYLFLHLLIEQKNHESASHRNSDQKSHSKCWMIKNKNIPEQ